MIIEKRFMTAKELNKAYMNISEVKLYELLNRTGCPKINIGRKYLIPVEKFLNWLEDISVGA
ncbi:MAG: helix-turn-helix domain-containing protein [Clostridiaceae bacterium]|nr:helix-turn-helix domain-containing protein [Clostridiaceae bacterium]